MAITCEEDAVPSCGTPESSQLPKFEASPTSQHWYLPSLQFEFSVSHVQVGKCPVHCMSTEHPLNARSSCHFMTLPYLFKPQTFVPTANPVSFWHGLGTLHHRLGQLAWQTFSGLARLPAVLTMSLERIPYSLSFRTD